MAVRKKVDQPKEAKDVFEDVVQLEPQVITFRISDEERKIVRFDEQIARIETQKAESQKRIDDATAIGE